MLWFLFFFFDLCFAMHVAAEAKPQSAMKTMKALKAMKAMKAIKGDKGTVCIPFTCMFLQETSKPMKTMKVHAKPAAKTKSQAWFSMYFHSHWVVVYTCCLFLVYPDIVSVQALPGPPEAAKDWVRYGVLWNDSMMSSLVAVLFAPRRTHQGTGLQ